MESEGRVQSWRAKREPRCVRTQKPIYYKIYNDKRLAIENNTNDNLGKEINGKCSTRWCTTCLANMRIFVRLEWIVTAINRIIFLFTVPSLTFCSSLSLRDESSDCQVSFGKKTQWSGVEGRKFRWNVTKQSYMFKKNQHMCNINIQIGG